MALSRYYLRLFYRRSLQLDYSLALCSCDAIRVGVISPSPPLPRPTLRQGVKPCDGSFPERHSSAFSSLSLPSAYLAAKRFAHAVGSELMLDLFFN